MVAKDGGWGMEDGGRGMEDGGWGIFFLFLLMSGGGRWFILTKDGVGDLPLLTTARGKVGAGSVAACRSALSLYDKIKTPAASLRFTPPTYYSKLPQQA